MEVSSNAWTSSITKRLHHRQWLLLNVEMCEIRVPEEVCPLSAEMWLNEILDVIELKVVIIQHQERVIWLETKFLQ